jgi:hypothetical protein
VSSTSIASAVMLPGSGDGPLSITCPATLATLAVPSAPTLGMERELVEVPATEVMMTKAGTGGFGDNERAEEEFDTERESKSESIRTESRKRNNKRAAKKSGKKERAATKVAFNQTNFLNWNAAIRTE